MWSGEFDPSKKKISLGGKKKGSTDTKNDVLKKAADERLHRALVRQQNSSSVTIQSHYRSYRVVKREKVAIEKDLTKKLSDLRTLRQVLLTAGVAFVPPRKAFMDILREFLFVSKGKSSGAVVTSYLPVVCAILKDSILSPSVDNSYMYALVDPSLRFQASNQLNKLIRLSLYQLGAMEGVLGQEEICAQIIEVIDLISSPSRWGIAQGPTPVEISKSVRYAVSRTMQQKRRGGDTVSLYSKCRNSILAVGGGTYSSITTGGKRQSCTTLLNMCFVSLGAADGTWVEPFDAHSTASFNICFTEFATDILSITKVFQHPAWLSCKYAAKTNCVQFWTLLLRCIETKTEVDNAAIDTRIIGNLLQMSNTKDSILFQDSHAHLLCILVSILQRSVASLPLTAFLNEEGGGEATASGPTSSKMDIDDEDEGGDDDHFVVREWRETRKRLREAAGSTLDGALVNQLRILIESNFIAKLFDKLLPSSVTEYNESNRFMSLQLCSLYCNVLVKWGAVENVKGAGTTNQGPITNILTALNFTNLLDPVVTRLWKLLRASADLELYARDGNVADASPAISAVLTLFSLTFSHLLIALDDEHLFIKEYPFPLADLKSMVGIFKTLLYRLLRTGSKQQGGVQPASVTSLLTAACRVYNQLYERNCRHSFCPTEQWYWSNVTAEQFSYTNNSTATLVLDTIPQVVPFNIRLAIFSDLREKDCNRRDERNPGQGVGMTIRRNFIYEDSFAAFDQLTAEFSEDRLKSRFRINFINEHGLAEAGIDGGGLFKDYIDTLAKSAFDPRYGLFKVTTGQLLYPNADADLVRADSLNHFKFVGRILGKALYEGILVEPQFAGFFLNKLLGIQNLTDDLQSLDPELYHSLMTLKAYTGKWEDLCLYFEITISKFGESQTVELIPGGGSVPVTSKNVIRYISLVSNYRLNIQAETQSRAFLKGFQEVIPMHWIRMFNTRDLQNLIGGTSSKIDLNDLMRHMTYSGGYNFNDRWIQWFWSVISTFTDAEHALLLKFMTSCGRAPLLGFGTLDPPLSIQRVNITDDSQKLPTSATCMNTLKLPTYSSPEVMREKLLLAISSTQGFDLT